MTHHFAYDPRLISVSALPVTQAVVRMQVGQRGIVSPEHQAPLTREALYVVALSGLPRQYASPAAGATIEAALKRNGKAPVPATEATARGPALLVAFPTTDRSALEDGEVEIVATLDRLEVKKKFTLKDMVVGGKLEL